MKTEAMKTEGRSFAGRYEILDEIAGGSSIVWKARDPSIGRLVAIKTPSDVVAATPALLERFVAEARLLGRLNHPGILRILHFFEKGEADERCHLVSEWRESNLGALADRDDLDWRARLTVMCRVLDAVEYLHAQGIVHGDLKPANILLSQDLSEVQVADLGIASARGAASHTMRATFRYVAPESLGSGRNADPQLDIYSLGMTFFEVFAGKRGVDATFEEILRDGRGGDGDVRWLHWHMDASRRLPEVQSLNAEVPVALAGVIARMAEKNPALRFKAVAEIKAAMRPLGVDLPPGDDTLQALDPEDFEKRGPPKQRGWSRGAIIALSIVGFLVLAIGIVVVPELFAPSTGSALASAPRVAELGSTPGEIEQALRECNERKGDCAAEEFNDETRRSVPLTPFAIAAAETTHDEFAKFVAQTGYVTDAERAGFLARWEGRRSVKVPGADWRNLPPADGASSSVALPVRGVSFNDAQRYCDWAGMRLPSEDEWEYAAQNASPAPDGWQPQLTPAALAASSGRFAAFGLQGNVWEWTQPKVQPDGPKVLKGGSYLERDASRRRPAARRLQEPELAHTDDGFRCARDAKQWPDEKPRVGDPP